MVTHFAKIAFSFNKLFDYMEILEQNIPLCSNLSSTATGEQEPLLINTTGEQKKPVVISKVKRYVDPDLKKKTYCEPAWCYVMDLQKVHYS